MSKQRIVLSKPMNKETTKTLILVQLVKKFTKALKEKFKASVPSARVTVSVKA